jgi:hypothetical protein
MTNSAVVGGGLANRGIITVSQSLFQGNAAVDQIPTFGEGGGLYNSGEALVETSFFANNHAFSYGGGLINIGNLTVRQTMVDDNFVMSGTGFGGGIGNSGVLALDSSTVSRNNAIDGGGIFNLWILTMLNSTISGNNANGGGGLQNRGPVQIHYSTIVSNTALAGGGILVLSGTVTLNSAIIALNPGGDDCFISGGAIVSNDYNIDGDNTCNLTQPNDLPATLPLLGPLQNNGGWTATHALLPGSPGIDNGDTGTCPTGDQRGFPRPIGPACDIGAYEAGQVVFLPIIRKP